MAIDILEAQALAGAVLGLDEAQLDQAINEDRLDELLRRRLGVKLDTFANIARALLLLTPAVSSATDERRYHAFVVPSADGDLRSLAKVEA